MLPFSIQTSIKEANKRLRISIIAIFSALIAVAILMASIYSKPFIDLVEPGHLVTSLKEIEYFSLQHLQPRDHLNPTAKGRNYSISTYSATILIPSQKQAALLVPYLGPSYRINVNGRPIIRSGYFHASDKITWDQKYIELPVGNEVRIDVSVDTSDDRYYASVLNREFRIGTIEMIHSMEKFDLISESIVVTSLILFGFYQIFFTNPTGRTGFWMGIYCFCVSVLVLNWGERHLITNFNYSWELFERTTMAVGFLSIIVFWKFTHSLTQSLWIARIIRTVGPFVGLLSILAFILPLESLLPNLFRFGLIPVLIISATIKLGVFIADYIKNGGINILNIVGYTFVSGTAVNDILYLNGVIATENFLFIGLFIFLGIRVLIEGLSFRETYKTNKQLAIDISKKNSELLHSLNRIANNDNRLSTERASRARFMDLIFNEVYDPVRDTEDMIKAAMSIDMPRHQARFLQAANDNVRSLKNQFDSLLQLQSDRFSANPWSISPLYISMLRERIHRLLSHTLDNTLFEVRYSNGLSNFRFTTDQQKILQIMDIFVQNIQQHSNSQLVVVSIHVRRSSEQRFLVIKITDDGVGMSRSCKQHVSQLFEHGDLDDYYNQANIPGHGFVLARHLVAEFGGRISVSSEHNEGTKFTVVLPELPISNNSPLEGPLIDNRILLIQAEVDLRRSVQHLFRETGVEIDTASTYEEAVALHDEARYDLVILDRMDNNDSIYHMVQKIRSTDAALNCEPTIIVVTTYKNADELHAQIEGTGIDHVVTKPVGARHLKSLLQSKKQAEEMIEAAFRPKSQKP